jgi:predicted PurR-regulated permease PerM
MDGEKVLDISWGTILKIVTALLGFYLLYLIRDILVLVVFALIISVLFNPAINFLQKRKIPRIIATILIYVIIFGILGGVIYAISPAFISEIQQFSQLFSQYFEKISPPLSGLGIKAFESMESFTKTIEGWLTQASSGIFNALSSIFGGIFSTISIFALAIFFSIEEKGTEKVIALLSPKKYEAYVLNLWGRCQSKVAGWFGARLVACLAVGVLAFFACWVLDIKYAVSFGFLAGILDIVPIIGPVVAGAVIVIFSALDSWTKALFILVAFIIIQQIEGNILTPVLTKRFVGLPPVLVLISLMVGGSLWGILGAILAIPLTGLLYEFLRDFLKKRKEGEAATL